MFSRWFLIYWIQNVLWSLLDTLTTMLLTVGKGLSQTVCGNLMDWGIHCIIKYVLKGAFWMILYYFTAIDLLAGYWRQLILRIFLMFFSYFPVSGSNVLSIVLAREREDKKARSVQNGHIKDLDPIVVTTHLPSIKIFFNTIQVWAIYFHYQTEHLI